MFTTVSTAHRHFITLIAIYLPADGEKPGISLVCLWKFRNRIRNRCNECDSSAKNQTHLVLI